MNNDFIIIDSRELSDLKKKSFCGYKKKDVFNILIKSIETNKIENACNWITECILSGYIMDIWEKLIQVSSKIININSPNLPLFLDIKNNYFFNYIKHYDKNNILELRNDQIIRNLLFCIITIISLSPKSKRYDNYPKIRVKEINTSYLQKRLIATSIILPNNFIKFNEPSELRIFINELYFHLRNQIGGYENSMFWIQFIIEWEKKQKKIGSWSIELREIEGVNKKYCSDLIWILWELILLESQTRNNNVRIQINSLFNLYKHNYNISKKFQRLPLLYNSIGYLTHIISFKIPVISDLSIIIQTQCNVNNIFKLKKEYEDKKVIQKGKQRIKINVTKEKCLDKLSIFNDLDNI